MFKDHAIQKLRIFFLIQFVIPMSHTEIIERADNYEAIVL